MKDQPEILVVDDDRAIADLLQDFLMKRGLSVSVARDGEEMTALMRRRSFDLVILDVMLPGRSGLELCREIRERSRVPIIMLTAVTDTTDRVVGLELGADDYVAKPFDPRELLARIRAVLRRLDQPDGKTVSLKPQAEATHYRFAGWSLDAARRKLLAPDGVRVELTPAEFNLLLVLLRSGGRVLSREQLIEFSGGDAAVSFDRSVDILISRLRRKLEEDARAPEIILTVRSGGYQFAPEVESA